MIDYTEEIKNVISEASDLTVEQLKTITNDTNIANLGIDSLSLVEIIIELEKKFNVEIELGGAWMEEAEVTIDEINRIINEKLNG